MTFCWWRPRIKETPYESNPTADRQHWKNVTSHTIAGAVWGFVPLIFFIVWILVLEEWMTESREWIITDNTYTSVKMDKPIYGIRVIDVDKTTACMIETVWWNSTDSFLTQYPKGRQIPGWVYSRRIGDRCFVSEWEPMPCQPGVRPFEGITYLWKGLMALWFGYFCVGSAYACIKFLRVQ